MKLSVEEFDQYCIVYIELKSGEILKPSVLKKLKLPEINPKKGIIISGRAPIWLYANIVHQAHSTAWIATADPRLGAIIIESHVPTIKIGEIIEID